MIYKKSWKYKLIKACKFYVVKALKDFSDVKKGDLGGYVCGYYNLSQSGDCWIYDEARVSRKARVFGNAMIRHNACIFGNAHVYENSQVTNNACVGGNAQVFGNAIVSGNANVGESTIIKDDSIVSKDT